MQGGKLKEISKMKTPTHSFISKPFIIIIEFITFILIGSNRC